MRPGDELLTRDRGVQKIVWAGARAFDFAELGRASHLAPILVSRGALGDDLPERDMLVAPNLRILVESGRSMLAFEGLKALVAAKHLVYHRGIRTAAVLGVTYVHVMCARHAVVLANGAWCELFQPADRSLNGLGNAQRNELVEIYPQLGALAAAAALAPKGQVH
jgi:hypothetical protein